MMNVSAGQSPAGEPVRPGLQALLTEAQRRAYLSGDANQMRQADDAALQEAIKTSLLDTAASTLIQAARQRGPDRVLRLGHDPGAQQFADADSNMPSERRAQRNEQAVYSGSAQANAIKMDAWLLDHRIRALNVSGAGNNCLIRCLVAAHSGSGSEVNETLVSQLSQRVRGNPAAADMLTLDGKEADEALAIVNEERAKDKLKPFRWVEVQPGHDGPQVIEHAEPNEAFVPLPVRIDNNHFQLLIHDPSLQARGADTLQAHRRKIMDEVAGWKATMKDNPDQQTLALGTAQLQQLQHQLEALEQAWA